MKHPRYKIGMSVAFNIYDPSIASDQTDFKTIDGVITNIITFDSIDNKCQIEGLNHSTILPINPGINKSSPIEFHLSEYSKSKFKRLNFGYGCSQKLEKCFVVFDRQSRSHFFVFKNQFCDLSGGQDLYLDYNLPNIEAFNLFAKLKIEITYDASKINPKKRYQEFIKIDFEASPKLKIPIGNSHIIEYDPYDCGECNRTIDILCKAINTFISTGELFDKNLFLEFTTLEEERYLSHVKLESQERPNRMKDDDGLF